MPDDEPDRHLVKETPSPSVDDSFAALLRGDSIEWRTFRMAPEAFLRACRERELTGLVHERLARRPQACEWPRDVSQALAVEMRALTARELLRRQEIVAVLSALAAEGIHPIVLKGTGLAYSLYDSPASRPRVDTDLLIRRSDVDRVRTVLALRGYGTPIHCDGELLFCQFPLKKTDEYGLVHHFDFHWKISTQSVFADLLVYDEIAAAAIEVPSLGPHARTCGSLHALLLACIHPVMHHRNAHLFTWIHDVHLIASELSEGEFDSFAELALAKHVSAICAHQLGVSRRWLHTRIPESVMRRLGEAQTPEASAAYLQLNREWADELVSSVRGLPRWRDRLRLLREVALPHPAYMLKAYGVTPPWLGPALLPLLYLHRLVFGGWKVLAGQK